MHIKTIFRLPTPQATDYIESLSREQLENVVCRLKSALDENKRPPRKEVAVKSVKRKWVQTVMEFD